MGTPLSNITVTAFMTGYQCGQKQIVAGDDGIFQIEFPHLRNNYPYNVNFKFTSQDDSYAEVKRDVTIGGVMRQPHIYYEIPMNSNTNQRSSTALLIYQSYIIDSQKFTPLTQDDTSVYIT